MKVTIIGTGYVGLVTGTCLAEMGNTVSCVDIDEKKIACLNRGEMPIYEPGLEELVARNAESRRLSFTTELKTSLPESQVCFIAVGTPPDEDGSADRRYVLGAAKQIAELATQELVVAVKSTVPVGTCDRVQDVIDSVLKERGADFKIHVVSNPEFLKEGMAVQDFMRPDRIVLGFNHEFASQTMCKLYSGFTRNGHPILLMSIRSSEMTKYAANAMLATRISFMNELARLCDAIGADIMDIRRGMGTDSRIGMPFLYAGIGYGGSCFPKDVKALAQVALESDCTANILEAVEHVNKHQKMFLANRIIQYFGGTLKGKRIALWGLAFKPNTDDIRESPALTIAKRLTEAGAEVCAFDPVAQANAEAAMAHNPQISFATGMYAAAEGADAVVLATEWRQFRNPDLKKLKDSMQGNVFFDGRNQFEPGEMEIAGIEYHGVGRGAE
ncbi:MAG: UDP-glucose/GDP-mannose dehydrogenase family protein [Deltaproteobacteria bacterium]|nr:UDP-glucose/GDP-mannose dehydrogenase family protein [Deltaproteobacteria bacterium]